MFSTKDTTTASTRMPHQFPMPDQPGNITSTTNSSYGHWSLDETIDPAKYHHLLDLPHKLSPTNYVTWTTMIESNLDTVDLFDYCLGSVPKPHTLDVVASKRWKRVSALVRAILATNMSEEVVNQIGHYKDPAEIWLEAQRLYSTNKTLTEWTQTITLLVSTKYTEGDDLPAHIANLKSYRRDLVIMKRDIDDGLFACFLRISMPSSWNYVFAGLPAIYTSSEVEQRLKEEWGARTNLERATSTSRPVTPFQPKWPVKGKSYKSRVPIPGEPFCNRCRISGHPIEECWSKPRGTPHKKKLPERLGLYDDQEEDTFYSP